MKNTRGSFIKYCTNCDVQLSESNCYPSYFRISYYMCKDCCRVHRKKYKISSWGRKRIDGNPSAYENHLRKMREKRNASPEAREAYNAYMRKKQKEYRDNRKKENNAIIKS